MKSPTNGSKATPETKPPYDSPEHEKIGDVGLNLANEVWEQEDFSDWEKETSGKTSF